MLAPRGGGPMSVLSQLHLRPSLEGRMVLRMTPFDKERFFGGRGQWGVGGDPDDGNAARKVETPFVRIQRAGLPVRQAGGDAAL